MEAIRHELFARIDVYGPEPLLPTSPDWFGPNGRAVLDLLRGARAMTWLRIERVGSVGGSRELDSSSMTSAIHARRAALDAGARQTGRDAQLARAHQLGQGMVLAACNPAAGALEFWWNNYPEVPAMEAVGEAAAALVVREALAPAMLDELLEPWQARDQLPGGFHGPNTVAVQALLDEIPGLSDAACGRILDAWRATEPGRRDFFWPGEAWASSVPGTRAADWWALAQQVGEQVRVERRVGPAMGSASHRARTPEIWWAEPPEHRVTQYRDALRAAAAAIALSDLAPNVAPRLLEAWQAR